MTTTGRERRERTADRRPWWGAPSVLLAVVAVVLAVVATGVGPTNAAWTAVVSNTTNRASTPPYFRCADAERADAATAVFQYPLDEPTGSTVAADSSGAGHAGSYQGSMTSDPSTPIPCASDPGGAYVLDGSTSSVSTPDSLAAPTTFSLECWFRTTVAAGKVIGFGTSRTGSSRQYDRQVYFSATGQVRFGTYSNAYQVLTSPQRYTDGRWHHVVATMSPATGMALYVDGDLAASNSAYDDAQALTGYWRIGYDNIGGWVNGGVSDYFTGSLRHVAVYGSVLTAQQVSAHAAAG